MVILFVLGIIGTTTLWDLWDASIPTLENLGTSNFFNFRGAPNLSLAARLHPGAQGNLLDLKGRGTDAEREWVKQW